MRRMRQWLEAQGKRRRWVFAAVLVAVLGVLLVWLALRTLPAPVDPTWERILETQVLPVCTDPSWPPFEWIDESTGKIQGFDIELAERLGGRISEKVLQVEMVPVGFDGLYDALLAGRCDMVLSALPYEPMRTQDVAYSVAYFNAGLVLLTREDTEGIDELSDLEARVVGVEWGFVPEGSTRQKEFLRNLRARRYDTPGDVLRALQAGEVEAALVDRIAALAYMRECEGLEFVGEPLHDVNYVIPVRPDSYRLLDEINRVLIEMRQDGTLEELQERWF
jgi:polar amino acid transport system substrate-binding protein